MTETELKNRFRAFSIRIIKNGGCDAKHYFRQCYCKANCAIRNLTFS